MKHLSRGAIACMLVGLFLISATSSTFAQISHAPAQVLPQPQVARDVVWGWTDNHPLDFYLALPVDVYLAQAQAPMWAMAHPLDYYLAFPVDSDLVRNQNNGMVDNVATQVQPCSQC